MFRGFRIPLSDEYDPEDEATEVETLREPGFHVLDFEKVKERKYEPELEDQLGPVVDAILHDEEVSELEEEARKEAELDAQLTESFITLLGDPES